VLAVVEPPVRPECAEERLLECIVGSIGTETAAQEPQHLGSMLLVESLERGDRHGFHHPRQTSPPADL
jgi:hypothetical protein